ncbi:hypothetical protein AC1031_015199 [Aphanomyces cochlioides]|nr:hypothetical protein AC1031_015199 [Aphanomyces cochlioides]
MGQSGSAEISIFEEGEMEAEFEKHGGKGNISVKELISDGYDMVIESMIRPPRAKYRPEELGPMEFELQDAFTNETIYVSRTDRTILNERQLGLACTHWNLLEADRVTIKPTPCLIYLHSNVGSRKDSLRLRDHALSIGFSFFAFDYSGSGISDGIYVTMGWLESSDLKYVLDDLDTKSTVLDISFFAHSMSCYPAIINVASRFQQSKELTVDAKGSSIDAIPQVFRKWNVEQYSKPIRAMVFDGAYSNMHQCIDDLVLNVKKEGFKAPKLVLKAAAHFVQKSVEKRAGVHMDFLRPVDFVPQCPIPALFVSGSQDKYVASNHTDELVASFGGKCAKLVVDADHYSARVSDVYRLEALFLLQASGHRAGTASSSILPSPYAEKFQAVARRTLP